MKDVKSLFLSVRSLRNAIGGGMKLLVSFCCLFAALAAYAQDSTVTGTVVDDTGEPIIGATVMVDGTSNGTVTDLDGNFTIKVKPGAKLKFSYIGYDPQTLPAKNGMKVEMKTNSVVLGGVEVVAYGVQKKVTVTGAISSVKGEELTRTPVSSVNDVLAGQLTGVTTIAYSGEPGQNSTEVFVRGQGTWNNSKPLIQVDGVEREMFDIDPEEIESVTVLKDASATAVFGVRGANGVVLITTKRGKEGEAKIDVSTSFSALTPTKMVKQANSLQYAEFHNQMSKNDGLDPQFGVEVLEKFRTGSDPIRFPSMRWDEYLMKDVTLQTKSNVNISGGTKDVRYFVSVGLMTQGGLFKEFGYDQDFDYSYERFNYRANLDLDVTPTTTVTLNVAGVASNDHKPMTSQGASGMILQMYQSTPFFSPGIIDGRQVYVNTDYYTDGVRLPFTGGAGALEYLQKGSYEQNINKLSTDLQVTQKLDFITKGLDFRLKGSYNSQFFVQKSTNVGRANYNPVLRDGEILYKKNGDDTEPAYSETTNKARDWYFEAAFNYNRAFGKNTVGALLLYNQSKVYYPKNGYSDIPTGYVGLVGRLTYDYDNRYLAEFNIGYNGSENFHPDRRFGTFPAGSIGWIMSNEKFFQPLTKAINFFKIRASVGVVGNDKVQDSMGRFLYMSDPFGFQSNLLGIAVASRTGWGYNFGINNDTSVQGAKELSKNNPDVTWEKATKQDYGFDLYTLDSKLRATFDYYREHRTGILLQDATAPCYLGFAVPYANLGVVDSWGWEVSLQWNHSVGKDWRYWATVNLSYNQNEVKERKEAPQNNAYQYQKGHRLNSRSMYKFFEFYEAGATEARYEKKYNEAFPKQIIELNGGTLKDGDAVYVDLDHSGQIDANDMTRDLGWTDDPQWVGGLNMGVQYKDWELSMQWTGAWGVSRMISDVFRMPFYSKTSRTEGGLLEYLVKHSWNADAPGQNYDYPRPSWEAWDNNYANSTLYEKDSKYLRLKTIQLSYNWKQNWMKKVGLRNIQVALSAYNLLTFSPYIWGDPETRASGAPSYPLQKTYTASLKFNF